MLTEIFCEIDDFNKEIESIVGKNLLNGNKKRNRKYKLSNSEIMTIAIYYHYSGFKTFKDYYCKYVETFLTKDFNTLVSYNRFIELKKTVTIALGLFAQLKTKDKCNGISFIDSFSVKACHVKRQYSNKVFKGIAQKGKTSIGWFYGFKVHIVINSHGDILGFSITPGNISDNNPKNVSFITKTVKGKLIGDKGYIGLFKLLWSNGIQLIHKIRKNMKNKFVDVEDKLLLKKRGLVESTIGLLKEKLSIEHTRHRSRENFIVHIFSSLAAYWFYPNKPSIKQEKTMNKVVA